ncbi:MAG: hypothetical protein DRR08_19310 [Candidatus Parabeggiatoa sp. nov. 2]|nr:MAG: hypothetical protein B6247_12390 [Beggiatoa sp. 4572_84]RKZ57321.1 MAG: hypothetical protein DRR08_19310 [Gammaproteobacteria bacterium]
MCSYIAFTLFGGQVEAQHLVGSYLKSVQTRNNFRQKHLVYIMEFYKKLQCKQYFRPLPTPIWGPSGDAHMIEIQLEIFQQAKFKRIY